MARFVGRSGPLSLLEGELRRVTQSGAGRLVVVRGRRQVGKSRLVDEFIARTTTRSVFFTATLGRQPAPELGAFVGAVAQSNLQAADLFGAGISAANWEAAFAALAAVTTEPSIVVIDEFPYLAVTDAEAEGAFQTAWDRHLAGRPILLVLIGSDLAMMSRLTEYGRPLYGRTSLELGLEPLTPRDIGEIAGIAAVEAFDAALVTGGMPRLVNEWPRRGGIRAFLSEQLATSASPFVVLSERSLTAEFPADAHARLVLEAIATGQPTFVALGAATGMPQTSLARALSLLVDKGIVAQRRPLSTRPSRETRYELADPSLALWLRFVQRAVPLIDRGRTDVAVDSILAAWPEYRGRGIEPIVRASLERILPNERFGDALHVGSWWDRTGRVEVDLVGVPGGSRPTRVTFAGSIKWRSRRSFSGDDARALALAAASVPGTDSETLLLGVSAAGFSSRHLDLELGPDDLLAAWP